MNAYNLIVLINPILHKNGVIPVFMVDGVRSPMVIFPIDFLIDSIVLVAVLTSGIYDYLLDELAVRLNAIIAVLNLILMVVCKD